MNKPDYLKRLIRMQDNEDLYIAKGKVGYKNALKFLENNNWKIDVVKYDKYYCYDTKGTAIYIERPIYKLKREIDFDSLKQGTLEKSCIDNELYLIGDYGIYSNGFGDWFFGIFEEVKIIEKRFSLLYGHGQDVKIVYKLPKIEKLTNQNYEKLLGRHEK